MIGGWSTGGARLELPLMIAKSSAQNVLPGLFSSPARRTRLAQLSTREAIRFGAEVLMRALNALAFDPSTGRVDRSLADDVRFRVAVSVALPLSLSGATARREVLMGLAGRTVRLARERGIAGPTGRAVEAARLLCIAVLEPGGATEAYVERSLELAVEAEVLAGCLHGQDAGLVRAAAEARALTAAQPGTLH